MLKYRFHDHGFFNALEKRLVLGDWVRFLECGLHVKDLTDRLYYHLTMGCGFRARGGREDFHATWFGDRNRIIRFLSQFDARADMTPAELAIGWLQNSHADLSRAMIKEGRTYIPALIEKAKAHEHTSENQGT